MVINRYDLAGENVYLLQYCFDGMSEIPYQKKRPAVVVCPGGGYLMCS